MKVRVEFQSYLDQYSPNGENVFTYEASDGSTVADMLRKLDVPEHMSAVIAVGDEAAEPSHVLRDGERVTVVPPVAGG